MDKLVKLTGFVSKARLLYRDNITVKNSHANGSRTRVFAVFY
jgi:hypothetical protein